MATQSLSDTRILTNPFRKKEKAYESENDSMRNAET